MIPRRARLVLAACALLCAGTARAWGPDGHHTVGAIADRLLAGTPAAAHVRALLGTLTLEQAAVWADCAKGVDPSRDFRYTAAGRYPECAIYETPAGEAGMIDFVRRNDTNCPRVPHDESCHRQYHYTDESIAHARYRLGDVGTRPDDVVGATGAAIAVLQGRPAPAPFDIASTREALLLLAHYVGDIHQPLHVGAVYLDARGHRVDPDAGRFDAATATAGGNAIAVLDVPVDRVFQNLHATWDEVPAAFKPAGIDAAWLARAREVPPTPGAPAGWPAAWATGTLDAAREAFAGLSFGPGPTGPWTTSRSPAYDERMTRLKQRQLTLAGARLAQVLEAIWPR